MKRQSAANAFVGHMTIKRTRRNCKSNLNRPKYPRDRWVSPAFGMLLLVLVGSGQLFRESNVLAQEATAEAQESADLVQLILNLLNDTDKDLRALGFDQVRTEVKGNAATQKFAALLTGMQPDGQVGLLNALADRGDATARPTIINLLNNSTDELVHVAAIQAIGSLGQQADVALLVDRLTKGSAAEQNAAKASLVRLPGDTTPAEIVAQANSTPTPPTPIRLALIEILASRRAFGTVPNLLQMALESDPKIRSAAMVALGQLANADNIPDLVQGVLKAAKGPERDAAEKALMFVCQRIDPADQQTVALLAAVEKLPPAARNQLLPALGRVGGPAALKTIEAAIESKDSALHDIGMKALANWPDASISNRLIELSKSDVHPDHQRLARRALIRVAVLSNDQRTDEDRLKLLQTAMDICERKDERIFVLQRARAIRSVESLRFLLPFIEAPEYAETACESIVELAHHRELRDAHKAEFHAALDEIIQTSRNATTIDRAQRYKNNQTWTRSSTPTQP